jgi:hypothetical protein
MAMTDGSTLAGVVELAFGETRLRVSLQSEFSFEALVAEIENNFGLAPDSFAIFDDFGKVVDSTALWRAFDMAVDGTCVLQVREEPIWRKVREMEEKIQLLSARCPVADSIMMRIEERSANRFAKLRSALQDIDAKVNHSIAPLLQSMALQQMDTKAQLECATNTFQPCKEMDAKVGSIAALLQSVALQQIDLKTQLDSLNGNPNGEVADQMDELRKEFAEYKSCHEAKAGEVEKHTMELQQEVTSHSRDVQEVHEKLQELQTKIRNFVAEPLADGESRVSSMSAMQQDLGKSPKSPMMSPMMSPKSPKSIIGVEGRDGESPFHWMEGPSSDYFVNTAYSGKRLHMGTSFKVGGTAAVPFARTRHHDRVYGSRSLPLLPPVK